MTDRVLVDEMVESFARLGREQGSAAVAAVIREGVVATGISGAAAKEMRRIANRLEHLNAPALEATTTGDVPVTELSKQARRVLAAIARLEPITYDRLGLAVGPCADEVRDLMAAGLVVEKSAVVDPRVSAPSPIIALETTVDGAIAAARLSREERRAGITHPVVPGSNPSVGGPAGSSPMSAAGGG